MFVEKSVRFLGFHYFSLPLCKNFGKINFTEKLSLQRIDNEPHNLLEGPPAIMRTLPPKGPECLLYVGNAIVKLCTQSLSLINHGLGGLMILRDDSVSRSSR